MRRPSISRHTLPSSLRVPNCQDGSIADIPFVERTREEEVLAGLLAYSRGSTTAAAALLEHFPSLGHVVSAEPHQLKAAGLTSSDVTLLRLVREAACRMAKANVRDRPALGNWQAVIAYLQTTMAHEQIEQLRVLFLDCKNHLLADELQQQGTVNHTPVYPREVMKRALILNASALIVVHNHPSGDPSPSREDIEMTRQLVAAAEALDLKLHDHVVIGHGRHSSFRSLGLL